MSQEQENKELEMVSEEQEFEGNGKVTETYDGSQIQVDRKSVV